MKLFFTLLVTLVTVFTINGQCTIEVSESGSSTPAGWTVDDQRTTYWLLTDDAGSTPNGEGVITASIDVALYNEITVSMNVATFGSGTARPAIIEYSLDGGTTYESTSFTTATPTSSSYIAGGDFTFSVPMNTSGLVIRLSRLNQPGRDVRVQDFELCGSVTSNLPSVNFTQPFYTVVEGNAGTSTLTVGVELDGAPSNDVDVDVVSIAGTAFENVDYQAFAQTITFPANGSYPLTIPLSLSIIGDVETEGAESFNLLLSVTAASAGDAQDGAISNAVITIQDDDLPTNSIIRINEVDADTDFTDDDGEFIELYSPQGGNFPLDGLVLVLFNGNGDASYAAYDLDGKSTDPNGYFIIGNPEDVSPSFTADVVISTNALQNGADGIGLYFADDTDFPNGTTVTSSNLIDGLVYDTNDSDDLTLLAALDVVGDGQINEDLNGMKGTQSIQRGSWIVANPTPRAVNALLPVNLTTFTATALAETVLVEWQTAKEVDNDYFTVARSTDGKNFEVIGMVQGNGTTDALTDYRFVDVAPVSGINYYRLTQTDYDGTSETFAVRSVTVGNNGTPTIFPNPVRENVQLTFPAEVDHADVQVRDLNGRLVARYTLSGEQAELDLSALSSGSYLLRVQTDATLSVERLVKL